MTREALFVLGLVLALGGTSCGAGGRGGGDDVIVTSGHIEATEVRIATKVSGHLEAFGLEEGDRVKTGQEIARIDTTDTRLALDAALADRRGAEAELALQISGPRKEEIAEAEAQVAQHEAELSGAQRDLDRMQGLLDSGSGTVKSRDDARTRREVAASVLAAAKERLRRLRDGSRREEIQRARARVEAAKARIAQIEQQIADASIASPASGVVTEKLAERGELLASGTALAVVTDLDDPWLTIYVTEPDLSRIRLGQQVEVATDGGQTRTGKITFIASKAEFTPKNVQTRDERVKLVYRVKVGLPNADGLFKPGMPAEARLRPSRPITVTG